MVVSLHHCLTLFHQQEDVRVLQLKQEREKCRVLEESLNVLAKQHHQLEQSIGAHLSEHEDMTQFLTSNNNAGNLVIEFPIGTSAKKSSIVTIFFQILLMMVTMTTKMTTMIH